jgi:hypothetical protein
MRVIEKVIQSVSKAELDAYWISMLGHQISVHDKKEEIALKEGNSILKEVAFMNRCDLFPIFKY